MFRKIAKSWIPLKYQEWAIEFLLSNACGGLFLDPGLGKTSITLAAFSILKEKGLADKMLVVAPLRVCRLVWPLEIAKWKDFNHLRVVVLHGPHKEKLLKTDADVYVINPEGLEWLFNVTKTKTPRGKVAVTTDVKHVKSLGFDTLVLDELSKFKNTSSQRFKMFKPVLHLFARRWGLTGSPAANGLMGLFGIVYMLDMGRTFGPYISHYRRKYFDKGDSFYSWTLKPGADKLIHEKIKPLAIRINAEEVLEDMPRLVYNDIKVDLPPKARKAYDEVEDKLISIIDGKRVRAKTSGVAVFKCLQLASGAVFTEPEVKPLELLPRDKREWVVTHDAKLDALQELIEELNGQPLLCAYVFQHDLARILKRFGKDVPYFGAGISEERERWLNDAWNAGDLPYLFGQPQSIGHGLNLQESSCHVGWFSMLHDFEVVDQFIRRVQRQGNPNKLVTCHRILARNTIDIITARKLKGKEFTQNEFFKAMVNYVKTEKE